jgi:hypothetical protein
MKKDCKTCTVNSTNDTVETCTRPCYLRYQKHRKDRICDLENKLNKYKSALEDIRKICNQTAGVFTNAKVVGIINEVLDA